MNQGNNNHNSQFEGGNVDSPASDHGNQSVSTGCVGNSQDSLESSSTSTTTSNCNSNATEGRGTPNSCSLSTTPMDSSNSTSPNACVDSNSDSTNNSEQPDKGNVHFSTEGTSIETPMVTSPTKTEDISPQAEGEIEKMSITGSNTSPASSASVNHNPILKA